MHGAYFGIRAHSCRVLGNYIKCWGSNLEWWAKLKVHILCYLYNTENTLGKWNCRCSGHLEPPLVCGFRDLTQGLIQCRCLFYLPISFKILKIFFANCIKKQYVIRSICFPSPSLSSSVLSYCLSKGIYIFILHRISYSWQKNVALRLLFRHLFLFFIIIFVFLVILVDIQDFLLALHS